MPRICPVPTSKASGFTLIETIAAAAIVVMVVAAAVSTSAAAQRMQDAIHFYQVAMDTSVRIMANQFGVECDLLPGLDVVMNDEQSAENDPGWMVYQLGSRGRVMSFALTR